MSYRPWTASWARVGALVVALAAAPAALAEEVYNPPDPEPSPEETLLLEYVNRLRADPAKEGARVKADPGAHGEKRELDWDLFLQEMAAAKPAPPLVMNLKLLLAARRHAYYLAVNDKRGHLEENELSGFTGEKMPERVVEAGYRWIAWYENVYAAPDPWAVHAGFVADFNRKSPSGMLEGRGHRVNMLRPELREVGTGRFARERDFIFCEGFGDRKDAVRLAGGVVYVDKDGDGFYSLGEGVGGVVVSASDGTSTKTWKSGGWALELKGKDAVTVTFTRGAKSKKVDVPAGKDNAKVDWVIAK
ncbi:MAG: CAP domain-containing protein [Myxococcota bacterium]